MLLAICDISEAPGRENPAAKWRERHAEFRVRNQLTSDFRSMFTMLLLLVFVMHYRLRLTFASSYASVQFLVAMFTFSRQKVSCHHRSKSRFASSVSGLT
eukprot:3005348-Amphidinium_carterae.1